LRSVPPSIIDTATDVDPEGRENDALAAWSSLYCGGYDRGLQPTAGGDILWIGRR